MTFGLHRIQESIAEATRPSIPTSPSNQFDGSSKLWSLLILLFRRETSRETLVERRLLPLLVNLVEPFSCCKVPRPGMLKSPSLLDCVPMSSQSNHKSMAKKQNRLLRQQLRLVEEEVVSVVEVVVEEVEDLEEGDEVPVHLDWEISPSEIWAVYHQSIAATSRVSNSHKAISSFVLTSLAVAKRALDPSTSCHIVFIVLLENPTSLLYFKSEMIYLSERSSPCYLVSPPSSTT